MKNLNKAFKILSLGFLFIACDTTDERMIYNESKEPSTNLDADSIVALYQKKYDKEGKVNIGELSRKLYIADTNNNDFAMQYVSCLLANLKVEPALEICNRVIAKDTNYSQGYWNKGLCYMFLEKRDSGYIYFSKAIGKNANWYYYYWRARHFESDSLYDKALSDINEVIKQRPNDSDFVLFRGKYRNFTGDYAGGLRDLKNIPMDKVNDPYVYNAIAYSYLFLKEPNKAIEFANRALFIDPSLAEAIGIRAAAKSNLGLYEESLADLKKCADMGNWECQVNYKKMKEALDNRGTHL
jgi:tetratricopeptide (TPR) repeat protein